MPFPGFNSVAVEGEGLTVPTPEYTAAYWYKDVGTIVRALYGDLPIVFEGGRVEAEVVLNDDNTSGLRVQLVQDDVWTEVLVDRLEVPADLSPWDGCGAAPAIAWASCGSAPPTGWENC